MLNNPSEAENFFQIPELGLGAAQLGNLGRAMSDAEGEQLIESAWNQGYRYFDTAPHYGLGLSEERLGRALRKHPRSEFFLSTKVGRIIVENKDRSFSADNQGFDVNTSKHRVWDFSRDGIHRSVEESLNRLGTDKIDLLLLHDPDDFFEQASTEGISALIELRDQGVVKYVGAGMNFTAPLVELIRRADVDLVMCAGRITLLDSDAEKALIPLALERKVGIIAAGVYNSGILGKNWPDDSSSFHYGTASSEVIERARKIARVCETFGVSLPEAAVAFVKKNPAVVSIVLGAREAKQSDQNILRHSKTIDPELWAELQEQGLLPFS